MKTSTLIQQEHIAIKVYDSPRGYLYYSCEGNVYYCKKDDTGYELPNKMPSTARYLCSVKQFNEYNQMGFFG